MADGRQETDGDTGALTALDEAPAVSAFGHLYRRYVTAVYSYIYSRIGHRADAEDLTEQTFIEALEGLARYEEQGKAAAWLFTIARRRVVDHYRAGRPELPFDETLDSPLDFAGPEVELLRRERLAQLGRLLAELEEGKLELLQLRFVAGLTYREIGRVVGSSEGAVKVAVYRLLEQLRARWPVAGFTGPEEANDE
jgi:RNA polymerase sigma-70 factor, ECF subfamily